MQHFVSDPTSVLVPSRSLDKGFCLFPLPKGSGIIYHNTMGCLPMQSLLRSSHLGGTLSRNTIQPSAALICAAKIPSPNTACIVPPCILQAVPRLGASPCDVLPFPLPPLPPGHSYYLTLSCYTRSSHDHTQPNPDTEGNNTAQSKAAPPG